MFPQGSACYHPKYIESHGKIIKVPCGSCEACLKTKQSSYELRTEIESSKYRYCYFITLTYHPYHLPLALLKKVSYKDVLGTDKYYYLLTSKLRRSRNYYERKKLPHTKDGVVLGRIDLKGNLDEKYLDMLSHKVKYNRKIPFLNFDDVQKFNKRTRKQISKISYEKIKIVSCGEYGPVSFRPHFHCLYFFNDPKIAQGLYKIVRTSWTFGRIDVEASRGQTSNYVAGYITSASILPRFYKKCAISPKFRASKFFGSTICEGKEKEVQKEILTSSPTRSFILNGRSVDVGLSWQDRNRLYPKIRGYADATPFECFRRLSLFTLLFQRYGSSNVSELANLYLKDTNDYTHDTIDQLKRDLYTSKKFCKLYNYDPSRLTEAYSDYTVYWNKYEMDRLRDFYNSQIEWFNLTNDDKIYNLFYDNHKDMWQSAPTLDPWSRDLDEFQWYKDHKSHFHSEYEKSIKHKQINDLNKIFDYG